MFACAYMIYIRVTKTTCEKFYYNWMISDSIIMMLALPNIYFEKFIKNIKSIKMGKSLVISIHDKKMLDITSEEKSMSGEILSHNHIQTEVEQ